ncbi:hypothetical protein L13192_06173 [Pyrenophora tritici-repentis]|nr:hypothetical protein L13192_06173 [Pyrenophora tritici-repentis]
MPRGETDGFMTLDWSVLPSILSNQQQWPLHNEGEARLLHHFIVNYTALEELIVALEHPPAQWNEDFLVTMSEADDQCHHLGSARVLNSICSFAADGGLREAASWISLRQHLMVSLVKQQPLDLDLSNYRFSKVFDSPLQDNESWTNRIIYIFASILQQALDDTENQGLSVNQWTQLRSEVDE